eukprot:11223115-Karenia_brevis.AAC.1
MVTFGEGTKNPVYMVLLDWEKAFDKISHSMLFKSMARMGIPEKLIDICKAMYANPQFYVESGGHRSNTHRQET